MIGRSNESRRFRAASCACALSMLLAVSGCALIQEIGQQKPFTQEPTETVKEPAEPAAREQTAKKPAEKPAPKKQTAPEPANEAEQSEPASEPEETGAAAMAEPELDREKDYALEQSDDAGLGALTGAQTGIILEGEGPYPTSSDLQLAAEAAFADGRVIGDIASFDAFPDIPGEDTVARVFREKDNPGRRIKLFAFHAPGQKYHRIIYGYVVEDTVAGETTGYFDENLDGVFEKITLKPYIKPAALFGQ